MVFGGVGSVTQHRTEISAVAVGVAVLAAVAVVYLLTRFLITPLSGDVSDDSTTEK